MATETKTQAAAKTAKPPVSIAARVEEQLMKAVLGKKITKDELTQLQEKVSKLIAFVG